MSTRELEMSINVVEFGGNVVEFGRAGLGVVEIGGGSPVKN